MVANLIIPEMWEKVTIGDITKESLYGPRFSANQYANIGNVKTIRGMDIDQSGKILYEQAPLAILDEKLITNHQLQDNDLVVVTTADCGLSAIFKKQDIPFIPSAYTVRYRLNEKIYPEYLKYLMLSPIVQTQIKSYIRKGTVANLPGSDVLKVEILLPPLPEQRKIAEILSTWDEAINLIAQLIAAKQRRKQALMQRLLTGQVRFPEFGGKWREVAIKDLGKVTSGGTPDTLIPGYWNGNINWCTPTEITALKGRYITHTSRKISEDGLKNSSAKLLPVNSILVCTRATVGDCAIAGIPVSTNQGFKNIILFSEFDCDFIY